MDAAIMGGRGKGGTIEGELWRATKDGALVEDLSTLVVSGYVDWDYERAGGHKGNPNGTAMACRFVLRRPDVLTPLVDWIAPVHSRSFDDGRAPRREQVGLFLVDLPAERHTREVGEATYEGKDPTWIVRQSTFPATHNVPAGTNFAAAMEAILADAGITRHRIRPTAKTLGYARTFRRNTSRLAAVNRLAAAIGYYRLLADHDGYLVTLPYRRQSEIQPSATFTIADPVGVVDVVPATGQVANVVIVVKDDPGRAPIVSVRKNSDPTSPSSIPNVGHELLYGGAPVTDPDIESQEDADALAEELLAQASSYARVIRVRGLPEPNPGILRMMDIAFGGEKAHLDGRYAIRRWRVGFTPQDALTEWEGNLRVPFEVSS